MAEGNRVVRPRTLPERKGQRAEQARALPPQLRPYLVGALVLPIVAALYWAQSVLMPVAVALLLSFLLGPPVRALQRTGLGSTRAGRVLSVVLVVMLVSSVLGGISYVVAQQIVMLSHDLPQYRGNLRQKIADLRGVRKPGTLKEVQSTASEVLSEFQKQEPPKREPVPVPVTVKNESVGFVHVPKLLDAVTSAGFVIVLVIFMLIEQRDLRNRLIRLTGHGRLAITTRALGDANTRITRYVLVQTVINLGYGMAIGLGLYVIGLPYVVLWGFLAFALRFVPYIGPLMAAVAPVAVSLAVFPGWPRPLLTVGLFLVVEALTYVVIEPLLYRQALGLSQTALFVAIAFWTWLWGPIGLLLATPLTVCLVVLGKHVPALGFLTILMADGEPVLRSDVSYYQRLLARDEAEANDIVRAYLERHAREDVCDGILLPALSHAKRDREMKRLTDDEVQAVYQGARETIAELVATPLFSPGGSDGERHARESQDPPAVSEQPQVQGCVAGDEASEMALVMLAYLLRPHAITLEAGSAHALPGEVLSQVAEKSPAIVCVASIRPGDLAQTRYLCKRLRARFPHVKILVARWSEKDDGEQDELLTSGADAVAASLRQARDQIREYARLASPAPVVSPDEESQVFRLPHVTRHLGRQAPAGEGPSTDTWFP
jgi:predicted PurR-regulated permease PerM